MYYRNPDYFDVERRLEMARHTRVPKTPPLRDRLALSIGMILMPAFTVLFALGVGRLAGTL